MMEFQSTYKHDSPKTGENIKQNKIHLKYYTVEGQGSIPSRGKIFLLHSIQTYSEAHPASYTMGIQASEVASL
jgi:hypothetical protein